MKLIVILLYSFSPLIIVAVGWWLTWRRMKRIRRIGDAAIKEIELAGSAAREGDPDAAHIHLARFRELSELHEEELKR